MRILVVEDDSTSRLLIQEYLKGCGPIDAVENGWEAVEAMSAGLKANNPYDLVCMDIMMPEMDGQEALVTIRGMEEANGISSSKGSKVIMITALKDLKNVSTSFDHLCDAYLTKPLRKDDLFKTLRDLKLA